MNNPHYPVDDAPEPAAPAQEEISEEGCIALARECGARIVMTLPRTLGEYPTPGDVQMLPPQLYAFSRALLARRAESVRLGRVLAVRVLQSDLYRRLNDAERADCDALVRAHVESLKGGRSNG